MIIEKYVFKKVILFYFILFYLIYIFANEIYYILKNFKYK